MIEAQYRAERMCVCWCEIGRHCKCKFCHLNEHAALRWHMWRMRNIRELKVNAGARAFKLQFSAEIFFCHHVRVAATNCCRSTLHTPPPPTALPPSPQHVRRIFAHLAMAVDGSHCARLFNKMASVSVSAMRCTLLPPPLAELKA